MTRQPRRNFSATLKTKVALDAVRVDRLIAVTLYPIRYFDTTCGTGCSGRVLAVMLTDSNEFTRTAVGASVANSASGEMAYTGACPSAWLCYRA